MNRRTRVCGWMDVAAAAALAAAVAMAGCDGKSGSGQAGGASGGGGASGSAAGSAAGSHAADDGHDHDGHDHNGHDHDGHDHAAGDDHDHGPETKLGEQVAGGFTVSAVRDGAVTPGSDAPVDVTATGAAGAKVNAVRLWIGTQDAKGSVKAKAASEGARWHAHVEIPKPLPEGSKLWVELEPETGAKVVVGFELKM